MRGSKIMARFAFSMLELIEATEQAKILRQLAPHDFIYDSLKNKRAKKTILSLKTFAVAI